MFNADKHSPPRRSLRKEIAAILVFKLALILLAGFTIFGAQNRIHVDKEKMTSQLLKSNFSTTTSPAR